MRTDDGTAYCLPAISSTTFENAYNKQPAKVDVDVDFDDVVEEEKKECSEHEDDEEEETSSITLELKGLPLIHVDTGVQTGVGARSWYGSAVLSAMLLLGCEDTHSDLLSCRPQKNNKNINVLELGSGAIGLVGMTMAWILAQKEQYQQQQQQVINENDNNNAITSRNLLSEGLNDQRKSKIFLTDCDYEVLSQLEYNAKSVMKTLKQYFSCGGSQEDESKEEEEECSTKLLVPEIQTKVLDWDAYDEPQEVLMNNQIDLVVGAELAYTHNNCLALQICKILEFNPNAIVWIVQKPRNGWFQVLQQELKKRNPNIQIEKFDPQKICGNGLVHKMAQSIMPVPELFDDINDLRAIRITIIEKKINNDETKDDEDDDDDTNKAMSSSATDNNGEEDDGVVGAGVVAKKKKQPKQPTYNFMEHIEEAHKLAQQLNDQQELALSNSSHHHLDDDDNDNEDHA